MLRPSDAAAGGPGALAVECREDDDDCAHLLAAIEHGRAAVRSTPSGLPGRARRRLRSSRPAPARVDDATPAYLEIEGLLASLDGHVVLRHRERGTDPEAAGRAVARLLDDAGGRDPRVTVYASSAFPGPAGRSWPLIRRRSVARTLVGGP